MSLALAIPTLTTERLILREPREDDFEALVAFNASERSRFVGGPQDRFTSWRGFLAVIGHWALRGFGFWTLQRRDDAGGAPVGRVGLLRNDGWPETELGWQLYDGHEGRGYATEAAAAARVHAYDSLGFTTLVSYIAPDNTASRHVAERLGAAAEGQIDLLGAPALVYRHPAPETAKETTA